MKKYNAPEMEVVAVETEDVILTSVNNDDIETPWD